MQRPPVAAKPKASLRKNSLEAEIATQNVDPKTNSPSGAKAATKRTARDATPPVANSGEQPRRSSRRGSSVAEEDEPVPQGAPKGSPRPHEPVADGKVVADTGDAQARKRRKAAGGTLPVTATAGAATASMDKSGSEKAEDQGAKGKNSPKEGQVWGPKAPAATTVPPLLRARRKGAEQAATQPPADSAVQGEAVGNGKAARTDSRMDVKVEAVAEGAQGRAPSPAPCVRSRPPKPPPNPAGDSTPSRRSKKRGRVPRSPLRAVGSSAQLAPEDSKPAAEPVIEQAALTAEEEETYRICYAHPFPTRLPSDSDSDDGLGGRKAERRTTRKTRSGNAPWGRPTHRLAAANVPLLPCSVGPRAVADIAIWTVASGPPPNRKRSRTNRAPPTALVAQAGPGLRMVSASIAAAPAAQSITFPALGYDENACICEAKAEGEGAVEAEQNAQVPTPQTRQKAAEGPAGGPAGDTEGSPGDPSTGLPQPRCPGIRFKVTTSRDVMLPTWEVRCFGLPKPPTPPTEASKPTKRTTRGQSADTAAPTPPARPAANAPAEDKSAAAQGTPAGMGRQASTPTFQDPLAGMLHWLSGIGISGGYTVCQQDTQKDEVQHCPRHKPLETAATRAASGLANLQVADLQANHPASGKRYKWLYERYCWVRQWPNRGFRDEECEDLGIERRATPDYLYMERFEDVYGPNDEDEEGESDGARAARRSERHKVTPQLFAKEFANTREQQEKHKIDMSAMEEGPDFQAEIPDFIEGPKPTSPGKYRGIKVLPPSQEPGTPLTPSVQLPYMKTLNQLMLQERQVLVSEAHKKLQADVGPAAVGHLGIDRLGAWALQSRRWTDLELDRFHDGLNRHGRDFSSLQRGFLPDRTLREVIELYYHVWKLKQLPLSKEWYERQLKAKLAAQRSGSARTVSGSMTSESDSDVSEPSRGSRMSPTPSPERGRNRNRKRKASTASNRDRAHSGAPRGPKEGSSGGGERDPNGKRPRQRNLQREYERRRARKLMLKLAAEAVARGEELPPGVVIPSAKPAPSRSAKSKSQPVQSNSQGYADLSGQPSVGPEELPMLMPGVKPAAAVAVKPPSRPKSAAPKIVFTRCSTEVTAAAIEEVVACAEPGGPEAKAPTEDDPVTQLLHTLMQQPSLMSNDAVNGVQLPEGMNSERFLNLLAAHRRAQAAAKAAAAAAGI